MEAAERDKTDARDIQVQKTQLPTSHEVFSRHNLSCFATCTSIYHANMKEFESCTSSPSSQRDILSDFCLTDSESVSALQTSTFGEKMTSLLPPNIPKEVIPLSGHARYQHAHGTEVLR